MPLSNNPGATRSLEIFEKGLRDALNGGLDIDKDLGVSIWTPYIEQVLVALDSGDVEALKRCAMGFDQPNFPYRNSVEYYLMALLGNDWMSKERRDWE